MRSMAAGVVFIALENKKKVTTIDATGKITTVSEGPDAVVYAVCFGVLAVVVLLTVLL